MDYGLQLYSVRDMTDKDLDGTLKKVAEIGYRYVEFAGFFGHSAEQVKAMLNNYGLIVSGTHSGFDDLDKDFAGTVKYHHAIGNTNYIVPGATIVENSIVAVTVVLNKTIASVWGFELDVNVPNGNNFEYLRVEDVNSNFTVQVADHGEKISMFAYNITGVENIAVESDVELVTLLFRVVAPRTTTGATALDYENAYEFSIDEDTILTLDADGEHIGNIVSDPAKVEIGKLLCMDDEDALTINDLRVAFLLIQDGKYASEFDIDLDRALTLSDISTIQALILVADAQFDAEVAKLLKTAW